MAFQDIPPVDTANDYIDMAFRKAKIKASLVRGKKGPKTRIAKSRLVESSRVGVVKDTLINRLQKILDTFPKTSELTDFYNELINCTLDFPFYKKSLGAAAWAIKQIKILWKNYNLKITKSIEPRLINNVRRAFYGRINSVLQQIKKNLLYLRECRKIMRTYPTIKSNITTIAIAGFPNVGKTTLLYKLTGSKPEIAAYAFTTKGINVAYKRKEQSKIQFLDTPGSLNRFEKMNNIEKQAYLAVKLIANKIIYIFDPTEPYPLEQQLKLLADLQQLKKPITIYISKTDIKENRIKENIEIIKKKFPKCKSTIKELEELF